MFRTMNGTLQEKWKYVIDKTGEENMLPIILNKFPVVVDVETYKAAKKEVDGLKKEKSDQYWPEVSNGRNDPENKKKLKLNPDGTVTLPPRAVFWLFCWADQHETDDTLSVWAGEHETDKTLGVGIDKKPDWTVFRNIFGIRYQDFREKLKISYREVRGEFNLEEPEFNIKKGRNYPIKQKLRAKTGRLGDKTLVKIIEKLYPATAATLDRHGTVNPKTVVSTTKTPNAGGTGLGNKTPRKPVNLDSIVSNQEEEVTRKLLDELDEKTLRLSGYQDNLARKVAELTEEDVKNIIKEAQGKEREVVVIEGGKSLKKLRRPYVMECYKKLYNYTCQFCKTKIKKKTDLPYIEACHIIPVAKGGNDDVNNVLVLCPNCHKKFDLGKTELKWNESRTLLLSVILIQEDEDGHEQKCERIVKFKSFTGENNT